MPVKPDLDRLQWFASGNDRRPSPFFVGRDAEIAAVGEVCAMALADARQGRMAPGTTQMFQGAPGAGKSALLAEMGRRWTAAALRAAGVGPALGTPVPVTVEWKDLNDEAETVRKILRALDPELEADSRTTRARGVFAAFGGLGAKFGLKASDTVAPKGLSFTTLAEQLPPHDWPCPVALLVDEIQDAVQAAKPVISSLHQGLHGLPLVPVFAGLGSSREHLRPLGVSRPASGAVRGIGGLSGDEAMQAVGRMLDECRVDRDGDNRPWASWLAERSEGWPQHLHNGMAALAEDLVRTGGVLREVDGDAVAKLEAGRREESYGGRVSDEMGNSRFLVAALLAGLTGADGETPPAADIRLDSGEVIDETERLAAENGSRSVRWRLPPGMDAKAFFEHMVHRGVFHQDEMNGPYRCPIPSLASYLVRNGAGMGNEPRRPERPAGERDGLPEPGPFD